MVYFSPDCWIKTSIELEHEGLLKLGAVVTNKGISDWSQIRLTHLEIPGNSILKCGLYACSPVKKGFSAGFDWYTMQKK